MKARVEPAAVLLGRIDDELSRVVGLVDCLAMAIADMTDQVERDAMRELGVVIGGKLFAMKTAMEEARETLEREQKEETVTFQDAFKELESEIYDVRNMAATVAVYHTEGHLRENRDRLHQGQHRQPGPVRPWPRGAAAALARFAEAEGSASPRPSPRSRPARAPTRSTAGRSYRRPWPRRGSSRPRSSSPSSIV